MLIADGVGRACENVGMAHSAVICAVCRRSNVPGNDSHAGDVFICVRCQSDATEFIALQDPSWTMLDRVDSLVLVGWHAVDDHER